MNKVGLLMDWRPEGAKIAGQISCGILVDAKINYVDGHAPADGGSPAKLSKNCDKHRLVIE